MSDGWIKLHRDIKNHWIWNDGKKLKWWIIILMEVNFNHKKVIIGNKLFNCKRGESIRSLRSWAKLFNTTPKTVRSFFMLLENDHMIVSKSIQFSTHLKVCNYELYQGEVNSNDHTKETAMTTRSKQERPTIEECKERKKKNKNDNNNTWRENFEIYLIECKKCYKEFLENEEWIKTQQKLNPNVNVKLSIEKGFINFWGTEAGWKHKKKSRSKEIDWKATIINSINFNKIYYNKGDIKSLNHGITQQDIENYDNKRG